MVRFVDCLDFGSLDVASKLLVITGFHPMSSMAGQQLRDARRACEKMSAFGSQDVVIPVTLHYLNKESTS